MPTITDTGLLDAAAALLHAGAEPDDLAALRASYPEHRIHLVSDEEAYDGSVHCALLIRDLAGTTVSLSVAARSGLPWALRGAAKASEFDLLAVNGVTVPVADALATLDSLFDDPELLRSLIDACLIGQAIEERAIAVGGTALQETADAFRRAKGLHSGEATRAWLAERSLSAGRFGELIEDLAKTRALRALVAGDAVDAWFAAHGHELDEVTLAYAETDDPSALSSDALATIVAAHREGRAAGIRECRAGELTGGADAAGRAAAGDVIALAPGCVAAARVGARVFALVLDRRPAVLDEGTREVVERRLFDAWLAARRREAHVQWFWGDEARTRRAV